MEVKSEDTRIGSPVARGLLGAMTRHGADQALLVAWRGLTDQARRELGTQRLKLRVWEADDVLDQLFNAYEQLPDALRVRIPLKRAWVLDDDATV